MSQKHTTYYKILEAFDEPGCPICRLVDEGVRNRIQWIFYEQVNNPDVRYELVSARGFCKEHSALIVELGNPLGAAIIYRDIIDSVSSDLKSKIPRRNRKTIARSCMACETVEEDTERYISEVAKNFHDENMQARILERNDFCFPHIKLLMERLASKDKEKLRQALLSHLSDLREELSEIIRKSDYRCKEPMGKEGDAWIRAVKKIS